MPPPLNIPPSRARRQLAARLAQRKKKESGFEQHELGTTADPDAADPAVLETASQIAGGEGGPGEASGLEVGGSPTATDIELREAGLRRLGGASRFSGLFGSDDSSSDSSTTSVRSWSGEEEEEEEDDDDRDEDEDEYEVEREGLSSSTTAASAMTAFGGGGDGGLGRKRSARKDRRLRTTEAKERRPLDDGDDDDDDDEDGDDEKGKEERGLGRMMDHKLRFGGEGVEREEAGQHESPFADPVDEDEEEESSSSEDELVEIRQARRTS